MKNEHEDLTKKFKFDSKYQIKLSLSEDSVISNAFKEFDKIEFKNCFVKEEIDVKKEESEDPLSLEISKNHKCEICGKMFGQSSDLKRHRSNVHERLKNHKCDSCGKAFSRFEHLKGHISSVHEGVKNHKCEFCGKACSQAADLKNT